MVLYNFPCLMKKKVLLLLSLVGIAALIYGCGQATLQANDVSPQPAGLSIRGTVYAAKDDSLTLPPFYFSRGDPHPGAYVVLSGSSGTWSTTTDARGEYLFPDVPDGNYQIRVSAEGYQERATVWFFVVGTTIKPSEKIPADQTMTIFDIDLWANPIITSYSPASGEVITNDQVFIIKFNEAMETSTVKASLVPLGLRTTAVAQGNAQLNLSWSDGDKTLTITPRDKLISNEVYRLIFDWNVFIDPPYGPRDKRGNLLVTPIWIDYFGIPIEINAHDNYADYRVASGGVPAAPSNLKICYNILGTITTEADAYDYWENLYLTSEAIYLNWDAPTGGGPITGYNIYAANGASKEYLKVNSDPITTNCFSADVRTFEATFWPQGVPWSDPVCGGNYPFINNPCRIKVVAFNGDGEGPGVGISAQDTVSPRITSAESAGFAGGLLLNLYYLPAIPALSSGEAYIGLSEPVNPSTVSGNVTIAGVSLTATLLTQFSDYLFPGVMSVIKLDAGTTNIRTKTVTIEAGLKDLAGNSPVSGSGDTIILP